MLQKQATLEAICALIITLTWVQVNNLAGKQFTGKHPHL